MRLAVKFAETNQVINTKFAEVNEVSDGGYERGYDDGYEKGETEGFQNGHDVGFSDGYETGEEVGYENGHAKGYAEGETAGYENGVTVGYNNGYDVGKTEGEAIGYENGYSTGYSEGSAHYDQFWDAFQQNGERNNYDCAFAGKGWTNDTFKPKYKKIKINNADRMFYSSEIYGDLRDYLDIEWGNGTKGYAFMKSKFEKIGVLDMDGSSLSQTFDSAKNLAFIELIKVHSDTAAFTNAFYGCTSLTEIRFEGVIGKAISFSNSPLSVESMKNIIAHLKDFNGTGKENTVKVTFNANCWEALEADSTAPDGGTWKEYVQFTLCWNV